jgi:hypothetical protein
MIDLSQYKVKYQRFYRPRCQMEQLLRLCWQWSLVLLASGIATAARGENPDVPGLAIHWADGFLTISGDFPGNEISIHYLEAYCRPGSTDRDWSETVIGHSTVIVDSGTDHRRLKLRDHLSDGVIVDHHITARRDEVDFQLIARNPTGKASQAHWAQPCIHVNRFTGTATKDANALVPEYARKCFVFLDKQLTRLPTTPWATRARYIPGQVYCPSHVDRNDVNPRPLSALVPSSGLIGCFSADERKIMAVAWQPYQELFLGVAACIHSDFRIGGLEAGETKEIRGKIYIVDADVPALVKRYEQDFSEHILGLPRTAR